MKKYIVYISRHETGSVVVEAEDKDKAIEFVENCLADDFDEIFESGEADYNYEAQEFKGETE